MPEIIRAKSRVVYPVIAAITDRVPYVNTERMPHVKARNQADRLAEQYGLKVADMPMAIQSMTNHPKVRRKIRSFLVDTITSEYHGLRDSEPSYETWHSAGPLATAKCLEMAFDHVGHYRFVIHYGFMQIPNDEWVSIEDGNYDGKEIYRVHLDDAKNDRNVPSAGTPYTIFVRLNKDSPTINLRGQLSYDAFMQDDRVLMVTGSLENREALAKMLFGRKEDGGEGRNSVGSYHRINEARFDANPMGRQVFLDNDDYGVIGGSDLVRGGRFVVVETMEQLTARKKIEEGNIAAINLDHLIQVLSTSDNVPDATRKALIEEVGNLYKR